MRLTASRRKFLEMMERGPRLVSQIDGSGSRVPDWLKQNGLIRKCEHPTVKDPWGYPADAYELTNAGRAVLKGEKQP